MSDIMQPQPFATQFRRILTEYERQGSIFGIPSALFHTPRPDAPYAVRDLFGTALATPVGPSAGPHTQLSQNIVSAWLCGGRFIELKTVQVKDDLVIPRPCIDMTDEGYNVEWSQELRLEQSAHEYVVAWAILHLLPRVLGWDRGEPSAASPGVVFDMSVGYDLDGIRDPRMSGFMDAMADASGQLADIAVVVGREFPRYADIAIPARLVRSVTVSTMHGCPPGEIERIARYLLDERGLNTVVKLNPTLLGRDRVLGILRDVLGFVEIDIPDGVFAHDLQYDRAVDLIGALKQAAARSGRRFGVKLSNTLAMRNHAGRLPGGEMYMSGRALYPVTMSVYDRLLHDFDGDLNVSYSGGADALNVATILSCGALPVTGCTDLLKPGGYGRLTQWIENIDAAMRARGADSLPDLARDKLENVRRGAAEALVDPRYRKAAFPHGLPKVGSRLDLWDCVVAPCVEACAVGQDVPEYAWHIARGEYDRALDVILARNPLPAVTGYVCTRLCQTRCTRNDYDESVAIRALKRVAEERGQVGYVARQRPPTGHRVAVVGSGPSGLAAAAFLAVNGVDVTILESRDVPGGMMRMVPPFRLPWEVVQRDIDRIASLGVEIRLATPVTGPPEDLLEQGFDAVFVASGFQRSTPLRVPGAEGPGVVPALQLLDRSRRGEQVDLGCRAVVIGGGDTAMDAARTARRFTGNPVTILYRRTRREMPAAAEEIEGALEEGNVLEELVAPAAVIREDGRIVGVRCVRTALGPVGPDGRRSPVEVAGSEFTVPCDSVVVAIGQLPELAFLDGSSVTRHKGGGVLVEEQTQCAGPRGVYAGGDVVIEPRSIISACADGRRAAEAICAQLGVRFARPAPAMPGLSEREIVEVKAVRARRIPPNRPAVLAPEARQGFGLIDSTLTEDQARLEAHRCVQCAAFCDKCVEVCPNRANYTFTMAPVRWMVPVIGADGREVGTQEFRLVQRRQIVHVDDFCNECDNCQTFCVHQGKPYVDKPRLFLNRGFFAAETDNAYHIEGSTIRRRTAGQELSLAIGEDGMRYEDPWIRVALTPDWGVTNVTVKAPFEDPRSLLAAAEMAVVHSGVSNGLPFLLIA